MTQRHYLSAATFAGVSAVLHLIALPVGGFVTALVPAILGAAIWAPVAWGLLGQRRLVAWLGFLLALMGSCGALWITLGAAPGLNTWLWGSILVADLLIAVSLFRVLWAPSPA